MGRTVRDAVFSLLREAGMTTVFGNPGSTELRFLRSWPSDFRYVTALHEGSAVAMADAYAQLSRNAAFVNLHSAGGLGNAMGSVFTAYENQTPLVITAGQQTRALMPNAPFLYAQDAVAMPQPYVKWSCEPARAEDVPAAIEHAYRVAMQRPFGPTFVSIPEDDWDRETGATPLRTVIADFAASPEGIETILAALAASARPAIVVGPGVDRDDASAATVALAERLGAAVYVSPLSSRCSFPERHPNFVGFLPPVRTQIVESLREHDLVLVLGAPIFTYHVFTGGPPIAEGTVVVHVTDDPEAVASAAVGTSIVATLRATLDAVLARMPPPSRTVSGVARPAPKPLAETLSGAFALRALASVLPADAIVLEEAPSHRNALHDYFPIERPGAFYAAASGSLGWALPAAIGAALARPSQRIVAILGDGSSMYAITALWTAARFALPITFVILNNASYAAMDQFGRYLDFDGMPSFDLAGLNFVRAAEAFGVHALRVDRASELESTFRASFGSPMPTLVDIVVEDEATMMY